MEPSVVVCMYAWLCIVLIMQLDIINAIDKKHILNIIIKNGE